MVLEEHKTSEHNSDSDAQQQQQDLSAAQKKMSLASKLRKQRRNRASGSKSPVPNETPLPSTSKSPVPRGREQNQEESIVASSSSSRIKTESHSHNQNVASEGHSHQNNDNDDNSSSNAPKKAASSSSSVGSSILHNKRRAMNLAKSRRSGASNSASTTNTPKKDASSYSASYSPYSRTKPTVHTNNASVVASNADQESSVVHHANSNDHDVSPVPSAVESELEAQPQPDLDHATMEERPYENPEVVPWDAEDEEPTESEIPAPPSFHPNNNNSVVAMPVVDDSDRFSQVSLGRSVVSNGVVDYDESIMNLARLDNFRSKTNQTRASQSKARQESSYNPSAAADVHTNINAVPQQISAQVVESVPSSASKAVRQWNPTTGSTASSSTSTSRMTAKQSWRARSPSPVVKEGRGLEQQPAVSSAKKFSRQPSWVKKNNATPAEEPRDEEPPASPAPSQGQYSRPGSPARSVFSSASRPTSPLLNMPKFSGARSDIGVSHSYSGALPMMPMPSAAAASSSSATRSWRASSPVVTKKPTSFVPPVCPGSPTPSNVSEVESTSDSNNINQNVPKAKAWSAKKQQPAPAWAKRSMSSGALSSPKQLSAASPRRQSSINNKNKSWMSSPVPPAVSSPRRHSAASPTPSWVKPPKTEQSAAAAAEKPPSIPTAKSWAANKQTPAWMKKAQGGEEQPMEKPPSSAKKSWSAKKAPVWKQQQQAHNSTESEKAATPSPRRNSIPSWMKPGHPAANTTEQQNSEKTIVGSPQFKKEKFASVSSPQPPSWKARTSSSPGETKRSPSPRAQSWKPTSPTVGSGPSSARKNRHSVAGASTGINCQRSPSPGVAQLQEQIFVTKLGVVGDSQKKTKPLRGVKGPSSPSPQVKQLQKIIFSPDKGGTGDSEERTSPAAGWWKRIPNAPEVKTSNSSEMPAWKFENTSPGGGGEEYTDVSPSPTMMSEPASFPSQCRKAWKSPKAQAVPVLPGTPTWLQDVAAFHSGNTPKNLPSQPPVWRDEASTTADTSESETRSLNAPSVSPKSPKLPMDDEQSETKMLTPTSTTSRDDSSTQQEDTKSLIQMAADSVLVIDYEQAMQRVGMESRESDGEDESAAGNSDGDALPSDLPLEFQKALTFDDKRESEVNAQPVSAEAEVLPASEEPVSTEDVNAAVSSEETNGTEISLEADQPHTRTSVPTLTREISEAVSPQQEASDFHTPPMQPQVEEPPHVEEARSHSVPQISPVPEQAAFQDDKQRIEENVAMHNDGPNQSHSNEVEYDENGFPVSGGNDVSATFAQDDFAADAFGSQPWTENPGDERKEDETNKILQYWAPEVNAMNDSSEWADRDPGLDSIAMASPEPKTTQKVLATAEKVLKKWENCPLVHVNAPEDNHHVSPSNLAGDEGWRNSAQIPHPSPGKQQTSDDAMWSVDQFTAVQATEAMPPPQQPQDDGAWGTPQPPEAQREPTAMAPDPMWGSVQAADAAWGVPQPDPFSPPQFDMPAPNNEQARSGDVFDPFGSEEDELFSDPTESVDPFAAPQSFVPAYSHEGIPLRPVSQEELDGHDLQMI